MRTGKEYLESLKDGRTVLINGEAVQDVTTHPAFAPVARTMAELFDLAADPGPEPAGRLGPRQEGGAGAELAPPDRPQQRAIPVEQPLGALDIVRQMREALIAEGIRITSVSDVAGH